MNIRTLNVLLNYNMTRTVLIVVTAMAGLSYGLRAAQIDLSKLPPPAKTQGLTYSKDVRPVLEQSCTRCHSGDRPKAGLVLDSLDGALKGSKDGKVILPGHSEKSPLIIAVARLDPEKAMPPTPRPGQFGRPGGPGGGPAGGPPPGGGAPSGQRPPGGPGGPGGFGPPPKPLTTEQVSLLRAWVDQGAK
jgi:Planctomycete cytochrome C